MTSLGLLTACRGGFRRGMIDRAMRGEPSALCTKSACTPHPHGTQRPLSSRSGSCAVSRHRTSRGEVGRSYSMAGLHLSHLPHAFAMSMARSSRSMISPPETMWRAILWISTISHPETPNSKRDVRGRRETEGARSRTRSRPLISLCRQCQVRAMLPVGAHEPLVREW